MRVLTINELWRLTRIELSDLAQRITNELPKFPAGSLERANALSVRFVASFSSAEPSAAQRQCRVPTRSWTRNNAHAIRAGLTGDFHNKIGQRRTHAPQQSREGLLTQRTERVAQRLAGNRHEPGERLT